MNANRDGKRNIGFALGGGIMPVRQKKGQADFSLPLPFFNLPVYQRFFLILQVKPSVGLPYSNGECEPGVRYCGRSAELVFRLGITFGAAVIVVDLLHHGMMRSPVDRSMTPGPKFGPMPERRTIVMTPVEFWFEAVRRALVTTLVEL